MAVFLDVLEDGAVLQRDRTQPDPGEPQELQLVGVRRQAVHAHQAADPQPQASRGE